jgi:hypothetical protein
MQQRYLKNTSRQLHYKPSSFQTSHIRFTPTYKNWYLRCTGSSSRQNSSHVREPEDSSEYSSSVWTRNYSSMEIHTRLLTQNRKHENCKSISLPVISHECETRSFRMRSMFSMNILYWSEKKDVTEHEESWVMRKFVNLQSCLHMILWWFKFNSMRWAAPVARGRG